MVSQTNTTYSNFKERPQQTGATNFEVTEMQSSSETVKINNGNNFRYDDDKSDAQSSAVCNYFKASVCGESPITESKVLFSNAKSQSRFVSPMYNKHQMSSGRENSSNLKENKFGNMDIKAEKVKKTLLFNEPELSEDRAFGLKSNNFFIIDDNYKTPNNGNTVLVNDFTFKKPENSKKAKINNLMIDTNSFEINSTSNLKGLKIEEEHKKVEQVNSTKSNKSNGYSIKSSNIKASELKKNSIDKNAGKVLKKKSASYSKEAERIKKQYEKEIKALMSGKDNKRVKSGARKSMNIEGMQKNSMLTIDQPHRREQSAKLSHSKKSSVIKPIGIIKLPINMIKAVPTSTLKVDKEKAKESHSQEGRKKKEYNPTIELNLTKKVSKNRLSPPNLSSKAHLVTDKSEKETVVRKPSLRKLLQQCKEKDKKTNVIQMIAKVPERKKSPVLSSSRKKAIDFSKYTKKTKI